MHCCAAQVGDRIDLVLFLEAARLRPQHRRRSHRLAAQLLRPVPGQGWPPVCLPLKGTPSDLLDEWSFRHHKGCEEYHATPQGGYGLTQGEVNYQIAETELEVAEG